MTAVTDARVLIVDDNPMVRRIVRNALLSIGIKRTLEAEHGEEALAMAKRGKPDVILCDVQMPTMDGLAFLRHLRADNEEIRQIPVIMLTSLSEKDVVMEAMRHGASGYVLKPTSPKMLLERIRTALERKRGPGPAVAAKA